MSAHIKDLLTRRSTTNESGCWLWLGCKVRGYGQVKFNGKVQPVHRVAYQVFVGEIPEGLVVMHSCDVRACWNPAHLSVGTCQENNEDMVRKGRQVAGTRQHLAKLNDDLVRHIRGEHRNGSTYRCLAERYGVDKKAIWLAVNYKTWKHVKEPAMGEPT